MNRIAVSLADTALDWLLCRDRSDNLYAVPPDLIDAE